MSPLPLVVPDASVLLKWVLNQDEEKDTIPALQLRQDFIEGKLELVVPQLCLFEVGNTIARLFPSQAEEILLEFLEFNIAETALTREILKESLRLVQKYAVTFYDAVYHALAICHRGVFLTADDKYLRAIKNEKHALALRLYASNKN